MTFHTKVYLNAHSYCCELKSGAVILELETGSYVGIDAEYLPELRSSVVNWPNGTGLLTFGDQPSIVASGALVEKLLDRGILTRTAIPARRAVCATPAEAAENVMLFDAPARTSALRMIQFVTALLAVIIWHRDTRVKILLDWLRRRQFLIHRGNHVPRSYAATLLASFFQIRIWFYTADRRCLFDSLLLAVILTRRRICCTFVIGISTKPFQAHAWVQIGNLVLNDTPENVLKYTPIVIIGESI